MRESSMGRDFRTPVVSRSLPQVPAVDLVTVSLDVLCCRHEASIEDANGTTPPTYQSRVSSALPTMSPALNHCFSSSIVDGGSR